MDFIDQIRQMAARVPKQLEYVQTEEATKNAFVMPFINALGYNVFDPSEVVPEFTADLGLKKGEKVDYAILRDGKPIMLFECKHAGASLDDAHFNQLLRYFHTTSARVGILTNGIVYRFFTDLDEPNKMDLKPFLELNLLDINEAAVDEVKRFSRSGFNPEELATAAADLRYTRDLKRVLAEQFADPAEDFVKFLVGRVYTGVKTKRMMENFNAMTKRALSQFVTDAINERLRQALGDGATVAQATPAAAVPAAAVPVKDEGIVTTAEEIEAYHIVKSIVREVCDVKRIFMRDAVGHCSILIDDNRRKALCRFKFTDDKKILILFNDKKEEEKVVLGSLDDIYAAGERLKATATTYPAGK